MSVLDVDATRDAARIATLRERCLERKKGSQGRRLFGGYTAMNLLKEFGDTPSRQIMRGLMTRKVLSDLPLGLEEGELLLGRHTHREPEPTEEDRKLWDEYWIGRHFRPGGQTGHCEIDPSRLFALGIDGLMAEVARRMEATGDAKAKEVYQSFIYGLEGMQSLIRNAAQRAQDAQTDATPERRAELEVMNDCCRHIAHEPPRGFRDAIQLLWFVEMSIMFSDSVAYIVPGHLDLSLAPFYEKDGAAGRITREEALALIECLYILVNEFTPDGGAVSVMVGGRDADGNDLTNDLSYLALEALRRTHLVYPTVGICWHEGTPAALSDLAVELIGHGYTTPAFFGDETIQRGMTALGCPPEQACHYINSTCVEITPVGASNVWVASPYFPTCRILLDEIDAEAAAGETAPDFNAFLTRYCARLGQQIEKAAAERNQMREERRRWGGKPLQSLFTRDCLERGRDIDDGGAVYNWVECSFVGLANLADSLHAIREEVFESKNLALPRLKEVLDTNFEGEEPLRQRLLKGHAKYGNDCAAVDSLLGRIVEFCRKECARYRIAPDDSPFVPGAFCWVMHERLGRECGATPDGRKAGFPFADGCGPAQGREDAGPTAAILSTTSWDHAPMIGGLAYNMKFNASLFDSEESFDRLRDLVVTFLRRGGFETQINVVDPETLKRARENPDEHRDLVVRIGGYTDYFVRLSPEMQDEVMQRTAFGGF